MAIFLRQSWNVKPLRWGSPADVQYAIRKNAEKIYQIDPDSMVLCMPLFWGLPPLDYSGKNNHGTNHGTTYKDGGLDFDGSDDYVDISDSASLDINGATMSFSVWIRPDFIQTDSTVRMVLDKTSDNTATFRVMFNANISDWRFRLFTGSGVVNCDTGGLTWAANTSHHLAGVYDGSNIYIYWDNVEKSGGISQTGNITTSNDPLLIGIDQAYPTDFFKGFIDEIRISNAARTTDQIALFYDRPWALYQPVSRPVYFFQVAANINVTSADGDSHAVQSGARVVVRLSNGIPYVIVENSSDDQIQVWKGNGTTPTGFSEPDVGNGPSGTVWGSCSIAVDSNDVIHIAYCADEGKASQLRYVKFASDVFVDDEQVIADLGEDPIAITTLHTAIAIDSNGKPHIVFCHRLKVAAITNFTISYINDVDNAWNSGTYYEVEGATNGKHCKYPDLSIDKDNKPVISYTNITDHDIGTAIGNQNDAESFTLQDIDTDCEIDEYIESASICVDSSGNHYVAYRDESDTFIYLRKHAYGVAWNTWVTRATGSDEGMNPSLAVDGTDIYIFYENVDSDIIYEKVTGGSSWQGDVTLETGDYNIVKAKWAYAIDRDSGGTDRGGGSGRLEIDYVFVDETATPDILFNSLVLGVAGLSINVSDGVGIGESLTPINPYDKFSVSDLIGIAENIVAGFGPTFYNVSVNDKIAIIENIVSRISSLKTEPFDNVAIQEAITTKASTLKGSVQDLIGIQENISAKISDLEGSFYDRIAVQEAIDAIVSNPEINLFEKIGILEDITVALSSLADLEPSVQDLIGIVENIAIKMSGLKRLVKDAIGIEENISAKVSALKSSVQDYVTIQESISSVISSPEISISDKIGVLENITIALSSLGDMEINVHDLVGIIENITTKMSGLKGTTQDQVAVIENISTDLGPTYSDFSTQDQISIQEIITSKMSDLEKSIYDQIGIQEDIVTNVSGLKNLAQDQIAIIENVIATIGPTYLDFSVSDQITIIENIIAKISDANCDLFDTIGIQENISAKASGLKSDLSEKIAVIESVLADLGPTYLGHSVNDYVAISEYINLSIPAVDVLIDNIIDNIAVFEYVNVFITPVGIATGWKSWRNLGPWDFIAQGNKIEDPPYNDGYWYKGDV